MEFPLCSILSSGDSNVCDYVGRHVVVRYETLLPVPPEAVWAFHASPSAIDRLTPPGRRLEVVGPMRMANGELHVLRFRIGPFRLEWHARISEVDPPFGFTDTAERSPFRRWVHCHRFEAEGEGCRLVDEIELELPFGLLGKLAWPLVKRDLDQMFAYRHAQTLCAMSPY
jgi:ligand-binding SRPBCC domain-containing protein